MEISIIIPAYNEEETIINLLNQLYEISTIKPDEIIVVDANSKDKTVNKIKMWKEAHKACNLKLIELYETAFPGKARNIGVKHSTYDYIAFLDCGTSPEKNWLFKLKKLLSKNPSTEVAWSKVESEASTKWEKVFSSLIEKKSDKKRTVPGLLISKSSLKKIGNFNEKLRACEDLLFKKKITDLHITEAFLDSKILYFGYPKSFLSAFKKWMLYAENNVYANIYWRKLVFSLCLFTLYFFTCIFSLYYTNFLIRVFAVLIIITLRIFFSLFVNSSRLYSIYEFILAIIIVFAIDLGRICGIFIGLIKKYVFNQE